MSVELRLRGVLERRWSGGRRVGRPMRRAPDGNRNAGPARLGRGLIGVALLGLGSTLLVGCTDESGEAGRRTPNFPIEVFEGTCPAVACVGPSSPPPSTVAPTQQ